MAYTGQAIVLSVMPRPAQDAVKVLPGSKAKNVPVRGYVRTWWNNGHFPEELECLFRTNTARNSLLIGFKCAVDALRCAFAAREGMPARNEYVASDSQIRFRIGIKIYDVVAEGDDLTCDGVRKAICILKRLRRDLCISR